MLVIGKAGDVHVVEEVGVEREGTVNRVAQGRAAWCSRAGTAPVASHHCPGVSPGAGIIALTNTSARTGGRCAAIAAVNRRRTARRARCRRTHAPQPPLAR